MDFKYHCVEEFSELKNGEGISRHPGMLVSDS
jgi:hypothetical protein